MPWNSMGFELDLSSSPLIQSKPSHSVGIKSMSCVEKMISLLRRYFKPNQAESPSLSLAIQADVPPAATDATDDDAAVAGGSARGAAGGAGGARLTHKHERQFAYVLQSLQLWRAIMNDMFKLWCLAEDDLLDPDNYYSLRDTGQVRKHGIFLVNASCCPSPDNSNCNRQTIYILNK